MYKGNTIATRAFQSYRRSKLNNTCIASDVAGNNILRWPLTVRQTIHFVCKTEEPRGLTGTAGRWRPWARRAARACWGCGSGRRRRAWTAARRRHSAGRCRSRARPRSRATTPRWTRTPRPPPPRAAPAACPASPAAEWYWVNNMHRQTRIEFRILQLRHPGLKKFGQYLHFNKYSSV